MKIALPLGQMSVEEKLEMMEVLWADLSANEEQLQSPDWHRDVLAERDQALREGRETPLDWEAAKRRLRELGS